MMRTLRHVDDTVFGKGWIESFDCADEVVRTCANRKTRFDRDQQKRRDYDFIGVHSYQEACELMRTGYEPSVEKLKAGIKSSLQGQGKRISFFNDVVGFAPIVPLAIQGVPQSMQNSYMKPIKAKVVDVYYDMTVNCNVDKDDLQKAGIKLMSAILALEAEGYKFNLYCTQTYYSNKSFDMLCTRVKNSNTPLDIRKISFPLTHPAYFRSIGFDWYTRMPESTQRSGFGHSFAYDYSEQDVAKGFKQIFGKNAVVFTAAKMLKQDSEHIKRVLTNKQEINND